MKNGRTLTQLAEELDRQRGLKRDFVLDTRAATATPHIIPDSSTQGNGIDLDIVNMDKFKVNDIANSQIGARLDIPKKYYDKMLSDAPNLLCTNINHWFTNKPEQRMVRTLDGTARAFLSDRYRPLDNYDLADAVLPQMLEANLDVRSCEVTDKRLYIKAVSHELEGEVKKGDAVRSGVMVSNSEVGLGSLFVGPFLERLVCTNGMVVNDFAKRKYHVGKKANTVDMNDAYELYTDKTKEVTDKAFWMQVRDIVSGVLSEKGFDSILHSLKLAAEIPIKDDPMVVVEKTQKKFGFTDKEKGGILQALLRDDEYTKWGLANAITRTAEDSDSYDRATELETTGWNVVQMPKQDWVALSGAA